MTRRRTFFAFVLFAVAFGILASWNPGQGQGPPAGATTLPDSWVKSLTWRSIGPANMGGRITDISIYEADPSVFFVATASGGLLKTTNNGVTFEHCFDKEATISIGAVCVAPSDPKIVWVGTGEGDPRNSVSYGDGVYKSTDGGKTWKNMGLKETFQIGKIVIHPKDPNVVYVGALGRIYGPNQERGLYKTTDGGKTWDKVLYLDERTGVIDLVMHPTQPDTLLVAAWERLRDGFDSFLGGSAPENTDVYAPVKKWGPKAGIYKTTDGGKSFAKLTKGLPTNAMGRIGLDYYRKDPNVVFAIVDCEKIGMGPTPKKVAAGNTAYLGIQGENAEGGGAKLTVITEGGPAAKAGFKAADIVVGIDDKKIGTYTELVEDLQGRSIGDKLAFKIKRDEAPKEIVAVLEERPAGFAGGKGGGGGGVKGRPYHDYLAGQKENVQDQQGKDGFEYGGIYKSVDGGESWTRVNSLNPRPMYFSLIRVDPTDSKYVYVGGIAVHRSSDGGKTFKGDGGKGVHADHHALWINPKDGRHMILAGDGGTYMTYDRMNNWDHLNHLALGQFYHVAVSMKKPYWVYGGLQDNGTWGGPSISLNRAGPINEDWVSVSGGDGFMCRVDPLDPDMVYFTSQDGSMGRRNLRTNEGARIRPVFDTGDKGMGKGKGGGGFRFNWNTPFILSSHNPRIFYCAGEFVFRSIKQGDDLKAISPEITLTKRGSATALAESPKSPDVLWVGTDDGGLWMTRNGGKDWNNVTTKVGLPGPRWVSTIEASRFKEGRAYVAFDAHRSDDDKPYVYVTEDYGQTWKNINANLPAFGSTRCLREDIVNEDLLYCGTEFSIFASIDRGGSWTKINNNLPTVAVHEIAVHPVVGEIVAATHGRSLWILDVSALRQTSAAAVKEKAHLYKPDTATRWQRLPTTGGTNRRFVGQNPPPGAAIYYSLAVKAEKVSLKVLDVDGSTLATLPAPSKEGLNKVMWDLNRTGASAGGGMGGGKKGFPGGGGPQGPRPVPAGSYRVVLEVDGQTFGQSFRVENDPNSPPGALASEPEELRRRPVDD